MRTAPNQNEVTGTDSSRMRVGPLEVETWIDDGWAVAHLVGEIDIYTSRELREAVAAVQARAERPHLVVLLAQLTFMDSSGLGTLVGAYKRTREAGGFLALVGTDERLLRILRVTGLGKLMPSFDSLGAALAWLDSERHASAASRV